VEELLAIDRRFQVFEEAAKILDQYYIPTRYANAFPSGSARRHFTEAQAKQALKYAKAVVEEAKRVALQGPA
jgi:HEPN domain-containing protein